MLKNHVMDVFRAILSQNALNSVDAVARSDEFVPVLQSRIGLSYDEIARCIRILKDTNRIFVFDVVREDRNRGLKRVEGYVDSDLSTLRRLKSIFHMELTNLYEDEFGKRVPVHQVIRELLPKAHQYSGSMLGFRLNVSVMLEEFEIALEKHFNEYTESRKDELLNSLLEEIEDETVEQSAPAEDTKQTDIEKASGNRALDTPRGEELSGASLANIERTLQIYGVEFFYRVNLRKYNFSVIRSAIERKVINSKKDLNLLKEMLRKVKTNTALDPELPVHSEEMQLLERAVYRSLAYL